MSRRPFRIEPVETYREVPIYNLVYNIPTVVDREVHEEEIRALAELPADRFGLVISFRNLSFAPDYTPEAQAQTYQSPALQTILNRAVAVARYQPESQDALIRTIAAHLYARQGRAANFAPDFEGALRAVRGVLDRYLYRWDRAF